MQKAMSAMEYQKQLIFDQGVDEGINQGRFEAALEFVEVLGIDEVIARTGFSREELESGKLNGR